MKHMNKKKASPKNNTIQFSHFRVRRKYPVPTLHTGRRFCGPEGRPVLLFPEAASLTVEAAAAVPLFFLCVVSLICMMDMYGMTARRTADLMQKAEKLGAAAGLAEETSADVIDLYEPAAYAVKWFPVPGASVRIPVRGRVHVWNGRDPGETLPPSAAADEDELVYVTDYGSVYHTHASCSHLHLSVQAVSSARVGTCLNSSGGHYHACEKCAGSGCRAGTVYITDDGDCYHNSAECGGLTRNVRLVRRSEVSGLPLCSRCAALSGGG